MNPEGEMTMKPDYRNWMPKGMIMGLGTAAGVLAAGSAAAVITKGTLAVGGTAMGRRISLTRKSEKK